MQDFLKSRIHAVNWWHDLSRATSGIILIDRRILLTPRLF